MATTKDKEEMKTLVSCMNSLHEHGYKENFVMEDSGLKGMEADKVYQPEDIKIPNFYRFEGESDPADNAILYAIETSDGVKGTLTDAYGPYADSRINKFIRRVEEIVKKTVGQNYPPANP
jgi:hypothetical protein